MESYTTGQGLKWRLFWYIFNSHFIWNELQKGKQKLANIEIFKNIFNISYFIFKILLTEGITSTEIITIVQLRHKLLEYSRLF